MISHSIETGAKKAYKPEEESPCCAAVDHIGELHGHGLVALAYKIKTYENLFLRKISHYTVL